MSDNLAIPQFLDLSNSKTYTAHRKRLEKRPVSTLKSVAHSEGWAKKVDGLTPLSSAAGRLAQDVATFVLDHAGMTAPAIADELGWHPAGVYSALNLACRHGLTCKLEDGTWFHRDHLAAATWELIKRRKK